MRGALVKRGKNRWALVFNTGYVVDPATGKRRNKQRWVSFAGTKKEAGDKLTELVRAANRGEFVEPTKMTVIEYLRSWLAKSVAPPMRRPSTHRVYESLIEGHIAKAPLALMPLQQLRGSDLEKYYADLTAAPATVKVHHAIFHRALKKAVRDHLLSVNPAAGLEFRQRPAKDHADVRQHCWSSAEAQRFLAAAKEAGPQCAAFFALALDAGARKSELYGLAWANVDLEKGTVLLDRQLDSPGRAPAFEPVFGPTKTGSVRTVTLGPETVNLLRAHRRAQAELRMRNRTTYQDFGLVFAKEDIDLQTPHAKLGQAMNTLTGGRFDALIKAAGVKKIKPHGLGHTSITLALSAGIPVHVVSKRVGHAKASMTLDVYAHALADQNADAALRLAGLLHRR